MSEAILRLSTAGGEELARVLGNARGMYRNAMQAINAESRRAVRERLTLESQETRGLSLELQKRLDLYRKTDQAIAAIERQRVRDYLHGAAQRVRAQTKVFDELKKSETAATRITEAEVMRRARVVADETTARTRMLALYLNAHQSAEREATETTRRESRRRHDILAHERPPRPAPAPGPGGGSGGGTGQPSGGGRGPSGDGRRLFERREGTQVLGSVVNAGTSVFTSLGTFGDTIREQLRNREQLDVATARLAAGDIGSPNAAPEIAAAVQRISTQTGMAPTEVLAGAATAQASFSSLGSPGARAEYLNNVLPMLARASVGTGTSLEDMVNAAGEFGRQSNINPEHLGAAVQREIARGRLGSISFSDEARHMGAIASATGRFMNTGTAEQAQGALDVASAVFQTAGQGGGGADVAATRARGFLSNLTSDKGRQRLEGLLGHRAFDQSGHLITREGETQSQAFERTIEQAWAASHGNAGRFLNAVGGHSARSREVADQFMRDLRSHGGHLETFRGLLNPGEADANAAFNAVANTDAVQRAKQENQQFYQQTNPGYAAPYSATDRMMRDLALRSPLVAGILDNVVGRGIVDTANTSNRGLVGMLDYSDDVRKRAGRESLRGAGWLRLLGESDEDTEARQQGIMESLTSGANRTANKEVNAQKEAVTRGGTVDLSSASIRALADALRTAGITATISPVDAAHMASTDAAQRR